MPWISAIFRSWAEAALAKAPIAAAMRILRTISSREIPSESTSKVQCTKAMGSFPPKAVRQPKLLAGSARGAPLQQCIPIKFGEGATQAKVFKHEFFLELCQALLRPAAVAEK